MDSGTTHKERSQQVSYDALKDGLINGGLTLFPSFGAVWFAMQHSPKFLRVSVLSFMERRSRPIIVHFHVFYIHDNSPHFIPSSTDLLQSLQTGNPAPPLSLCPHCSSLHSHQNSKSHNQYEKTFITITTNVNQSIGPNNSTRKILKSRPNLFLRLKRINKSPNSIDNPLPILVSELCLEIISEYTID